MAAVAAPAAEPAGAAPGAGVAANADAAVRQQVELFVRAELHPLLKRQQISLALHDAGKCAHLCCCGVRHEVHATLTLERGHVAMPCHACHAMHATSRCHSMPSCHAAPHVQRSVCPPSSNLPSRPCLRRHPYCCLAVCERCTAKVMACHVGAMSADFLVPEAGSIRALVKRYLDHMRRQV